MLEVINRYKHGYVIIPVIRAFEEKGLFNYFQKNKTNTSQHISKAFGANSGHLQVALRIMESLGWVNRNDRDEYSLAEKAKERHDIPTDILALYEFDMESYVQGKGEHSLKEWIKKSCQNWSTANKFIVDLLDGILVISLLLALKKYDLLALVENNKKVTLDISKLANNVSQEILVLFAKKGWTGKNYQTVIVTNIGRFIFERIFIAATVASYKPMLSHLPDLLFGNQEKVFQRDEAGHEKHIDRTLNVVGSGFQHVKYFREIETLIISIYDQPSFEEQPKYIADMGCGNGLLLKRIYETIRDKTNQGQRA